jgi:hypothetical protein
VVEPSLTVLLADVRRDEPGVHPRLEDVRRVLARVVVPLGDRRDVPVGELAGLGLHVARSRSKRSENNEKWRWSL